MSAEEVELRIDAIASGGDGVGRDPDGRVVFVPLTAPGDRVRAEITTAKARWARGRVVELLERADDRVEPPCPVFGVCGGCRLQHLPWERQVRAKRSVVAAALKRIGGIDVEVPDVIRAGEPYGYRNRVTLTVKPGDVGSGGAARAGFHGLHDPGEVVDCPNCLLAEEPVRAAWDALAPWDALPRVTEGGELRVTIRANAAGRIALLVEGGTSAGDREAVAELLPGLESYLWIDASGHSMLLGGRASFAEEWQGIKLDLDPRVFLQVNRAVAGAMDEWLDERLREAVGPRIDGVGLRSSESLRGLRVAEMYAGVGTRPIRWARSGARVAMCEVDAAACAAARKAVRKAGGDVKVRQGRVEDHLDLLAADVVVLNPPRAGLGEPVRDALAAGPAPWLAYVSCDPATLARDLEHVSAAYRVAAVQPFDAFPQTAHVETLAWLERRRDLALPDPAAEEAGKDETDTRGSRAEGPWDDVGPDESKWRIA